MLFAIDDLARARPPEGPIRSRATVATMTCTRTHLCCSRC